MFKRIWKKIINRFKKEDYVINVEKAEKNGWTYLPVLYESDAMLGALKPEVDMKTFYKE